MLDAERVSNGGFKTSLKALKSSKAAEKERVWVGLERMWRLAVPLEQALLAESPDASEEAQARYSAVREAFAEVAPAVSAGLGVARSWICSWRSTSRTSSGLSVGPRSQEWKPLRVEVRGTAGGRRGWRLGAP